MNAVRPSIVAAFICLALGSTRILAQTVPVPEYYGVYVVDGDHLVKLDGKTVTAPHNALVPFGMRNGVGNVINHQPAALPAQSVSVPVFPANFKIIIYNDSPLDLARSIHLTPMVFVNRLNVDTGVPSNVRRSDMERGWDDGDPSELVMANTGGKQADLELLMKPMPGQKDMVVAGLAEPLQPGVYRISQGVPDPMAAMMGGASKGLAFAVEPLAQAQTDTCVDETLSYMMTMSKTHYTKCSSAPVSAMGDAISAAPSGADVSNAGSQTCSDYAACMKAGTSANQAKDWPSAIADFQAASHLQPQDGQVLIWLGRTYLAAGQNDDFFSSWDKALSLGARLMIAACHERTLQPCERGDLALSSHDVAFLARGSTGVFSGALTDIQPGKILDNPGAAHVSYSLKVNGKSYSIDFVPEGDWTQCRFDLMVQCPADLTAQQLVIANFVSREIARFNQGTAR